MKTVSESWGAAEAKRFAVPGRYFRLLSTTSPVDVEFFQGGRHLSEEKASGVEAGYFAIPPKGFSEFKITSALAQAVKFAVTGGSGGYDRNIGDVQLTSGILTDITNPINVEGPRIVSGAPALADLPIPVRDLGALYGTSFASASNLTANTSQQLITPGANANGMIIWRLIAMSRSTAMPQIAYAAHTAAPNSVIVGDVLASNDAGAIISGDMFAFCKLERPIFVPAGKGLFFTAGATETLCLRSGLYTLF